MSKQPPESAKEPATSEREPRSKLAEPRGWWQRIEAALLLRTLAVGAVGGIVFYFFNLPLAWMLGAMVFTTVAALAGLRMRLPTKLRGGFITIIGVFLGSAFTPDILDQIRQWPISIVG